LQTSEHRTLWTLAAKAGAIVVGVALMTACGSTVQYAGSARGGGLGDAPGNQGLQDPGLAGPQSPGGRPLSPGAVGGTQGPVTSGQTPGGRGTTPTAPSGLSLGPGVTAKTIRVGFSIQENNATVNSLAATYNVQLPDTRGAYEALVAYLNAHGGVAGRKLQPVYHSYDPTSGNADQLGEETCAAFTQDASVFAALDTPSGSNTYRSCMQKRGRLMLQAGLYFGSQPSWQQYPNQVAADGLPLDQGGTLLARHLVGTGFLSRSTKIGALVRSSADLKHAYQQGFVKTLATLGLNVAQAQFIQDPQDASQIGGYTSEISSAVLKFQSSGVDRVVFFDVGSYSALVFAQTADKQQYHPRYGFSSMNSITALTGSSTTAPKGQLVGAQGVSWIPQADGLPAGLTPNARLCLAILKKAGITPADSGTEGAYLQTCQTIFLFRAAADAAGANLNRDTFIRAAEGLGSAFQGTNTWDGLSRFGADDHSGVSVFRPFAYDESCSCFRVTGPVRSVESA
jgi:hypothetical protein